MRLLFRVSIFWIVVGFVIGLVLRARVSWRRLPVIYALGALPPLAHLGYMSAYTLRNADRLGGTLALYLAVSLALCALLLWAGWRYLRTPPLRLLLVALLLVLADALPLFFFSRALRGAGVGTDAIPLVALLSGALFVASLQFAFVFGRASGGPGRGWLARLRR